LLLSAVSKIVNPHDLIKTLGFFDFISDQTKIKLIIFLVTAELFLVFALVVNYKLYLAL